MECPLRAIVAVCQDWTHAPQKTTTLIDELHPMLEVVPAKCLADKWWSGNLFCWK
jgi:hypothetical protein